MRTLLALVLALLLTGPATAQGTLARTRLEPDQSPSVPDAPARSSCADGPLNDLEAGTAEALLQLGYLAVSSPFWAAALLLGDDQLHCGYFAGPPYSGARAGYLKVAAVLDDTESASLRQWAVRVGIEDGHDLHALNRVGTLFTLDTSTRWGVSSRWDWYHERLPGDASDSTTLGDFHVTYRIAQAEFAQIHAGLGGRWRFDRHTVDGGGSFLYSVDVFPCRPWVISTSVDLGNLDSKFVVRARGSLGLQMSHAEVVFGYDFLRFGDVNLQGPFAGLRLWF